MNNKVSGMLRSLCRQFTKLSEEDITFLEEIEQHLCLAGEAQDCDVFIDCITNDPDRAIVVAEYRPEDSVYRNSVVGMYAKRENEPAALRTFETGTPTRGLKGLSQENKAIIQNVSAIRNPHGDMIGVFIMERDETAAFSHNYFRDEMHEVSEEHRISLTNYLDDAVIYFNNLGTAVYANPRAQIVFQELGYQESIVGMNFQNLVIGGITQKKIMREVYIEIQNVTIGAHIFRIKYHTISDQENSDIGFAMIMKDVTEIHTIEKQLILKTVDLKEIHHRVKNNLQTIASLLRLQARRLEDSAEKKILQENINRIISIALTHEILAQSGNDDVYIKEIVQRLVLYIAQGALADTSQVETVVQGDDILLRSDIATSISLVVNELVQNSFEHGFPEGHTGEITITIENLPTIGRIIIADNGVGFDITDYNNNSLGLVIVKSMIEEKLNGTIEITSTSEGTIAQLEFPINYN